MNKIGLAVYGLEIYQTRRKKKGLNTVNSRVDFLDIFVSIGKCFKFFFLGYVRVVYEFIY